MRPRPVLITAILPALVWVWNQRFITSITKEGSASRRSSSAWCTCPRPCPPPSKRSTPQWSQQAPKPRSSTWPRLMATQMTAAGLGPGECRRELTGPGLALWPRGSPLTGRAPLGRSADGEPCEILLSVVTGPIDRVSVQHLQALGFEAQQTWV